MQTDTTSAVLDAANNINGGADVADVVAQLDAEHGSGNVADALVGVFDRLVASTN